MYRSILIILIMTFLFPNVVGAYKPVVNPNKPYTYQVLKKDLSQMRTRFHPHVKVETIGKSHFGRKILAVKLGEGEQNILFIGAHHGREWLTSSLIMKMIEEYAGAYKERRDYDGLSTEILDEVSIWFVPMLNPDGVEIQLGNMKGLSRQERKRVKFLNEGSNDFSRWKANGEGIDLNRQYPAGWGKLPVESISPSYQFYKGKKPLEAKEVQIITDFTKKISPIIAVAYHSSGREIYWNYKNGENWKRDEKIAWRVSMLTGYKMSEPPEKAYGGGYTDWFITTYHKPGLTIEICPLVENTNPPLATFEEEWERNKYVGIVLANEAKKVDKAS